MSRTLDTLDTIAVKTNLCRKYLVGALCNFKTDLSPSFCSQIMYVQFCETDLFQQISSGEYFNISRDKTLEAKRKINDWSKPLLNMNIHWFGGAICLFYGTRCKNKRKSSSLYGTQNFVLPSTRKLYSLDNKLGIFLTRRLLKQNITNLWSRLYSPMRLDDVDSLQMMLITVKHLE